MARSRTHDGRKLVRLVRPEGATDGAERAPGDRDSPPCSACGRPAGRDQGASSVPERPCPRRRSRGVLEVRDQKGPQPGPTRGPGPEEGGTMTRKRSSTYVV